MVRFIKRVFKGIFVGTVCFLAMVIFLVVYSLKIEPSLLISKEYKLNSDQGNEKESIKVVQFSDIHLGEFYTLEQLEKVVEKINSKDPDIIVFTGDLIDNASQYDKIHKVSEVLSKLEAKLGKYAIYGNHDYGGGAERFYEDIMEKSGFKVLVNESEAIALDNGKSITIFGIDDVLLGNPQVETSMKNLREDSYNLMLIHEPDYVDNFKEYALDLILAGHSHGGQVYIPFYGTLIDTAYAEKYSRGFYDIDNQRGTKLYVNTGLGNTKLPVRFGNTPKISVFKIAI